MATLPPSLLIKQVAWTVDMIENYIVELLNKYLKYNIPVELQYHEDVSQPVSLVAGYLLSPDGSITVQEVCYLGESDGSEELQLTIQYEFPEKVKIISPIFFMNVFHGVVIVRKFKLDVRNYEAKFEKVLVQVIGKKYERVKNRVEQALKR